ncbi:MAG: NADH-quinone oxidoreductase subunit L [Candidatus Eisenbacteria bacterium]|nr:NADH-quinone oxidoreductase subunit L [Candidatus Eisenbacteria bacterium]
MLWIIPALPLAAVALNLLFGDRLGKKGTSFLACGAVGLAFAAAIRAVLTLAARSPEERQMVETAWTWFRVGDFSADVSFLLDPLSAIMVLVVTGVGFLIHIYSIGYMAEDPSFRRFFLYLNLFMFAMLTLVLADNYLLMFVGWEGVGLCSYLLIGFWHEKQSATDAGKKAFIVNRIGDFGFLLGVMFLIAWTGSVNYERVFAAAPHLFVAGGSIITLATILLFVGATGKSAQIPLFVWLPDAMEGPTPVSALIHAATMVTAGVYMVVRSHVLFEMAPATLEVVAVIGAATALMAATIGLVQNDIKRVLAYSTVSQLGYMFFACGVGAFGAGIFHVMTHAFFKALLFLGAGSVIYGMHHEQDMRKMGGLAGKMPITHLTMLLATIAIAGIPPFAGFWSKDEILAKAFATGHYGIFAAGLLGALMTAFYMFRLYVLTFRGKPRFEEHAAHGHADAHGHDAHAAHGAHDDHGHDHGHGGPVKESPWSMTVPLSILAVLSVAGGWVGIGKPFIHGESWMATWLEPVLGHGPHMKHLSAPAEFALMGLSVAVAAFGIFMAFRAYLQQPSIATAVRERFAGVHNALYNKYWVDEFYGAIAVTPIHQGAMRLWRFWDEKVVDGTVNGVGYVLEGVSALLRLFQTGYVGTYALFIAFGVLALFLHFLRS